MKTKKLLKLLWSNYEKSDTFKSLSLDQQESGKEKGYKGIKEVVTKILGKEKKFRLDGKSVYLV